MQTEEKILKIKAENNARVEDLVEILRDETCGEALFSAADALKTEVFGNRVFVRCIIEFSNYCRCRCSYCGLNCENANLERYRMPPDALAAAGIEAGKIYKTVILQSGEDLHYTAEMLADIVRKIKQNTNCAVTLSIGERMYEEYKIMREAGADRFLIKHETSDMQLYKELHKADFADRIMAQRRLKTLGFELGGGFMVGLPGQTDETLANDLAILKEMRVDMAGIGPFIAHPETAVGDAADGDAYKTLKVLALARLLLPKANLPSTTALNVKGGMRDALFCGANVIMQKATPPEYRALYDIYPGRDAEDMPLLEQYEKLEKTLLEYGLVTE
ncbi:MAG: [FeFe] hydrogenase H-cluster radical SAM maturase HydE [Christensenellaceae bacterium]|jgi:biotin synthase